MRPSNVSITCSQKGLRLPGTLIPLVLLVAFLGPALSIPYSRPLLSNPTISTFADDSSPIDIDPAIAQLLHPSSFIRRQSSFTSLRIPTCALSCYINTLTTDGCDSEIDFECHCSKGNVLGKAESCIKKACDEDDQKDAESKISNACQAAAGGNGRNGDGDGSGDGESATPSGTVSSTRSVSSSSDTTTSTNSPESLNPEPTPAPGPTPAPRPTNRSGSPSAPSTTNPSETIALPQPTDTPLALLPLDRQLSPGAKAGIAVSVAVFASAILLTIYLYIRRLKKDLALAKAAAGVPESVWRANISTDAEPSGVGRRRSWGGRGRMSSGEGGWGGGSPVSPLSPRGGMEEGMTGVLKKKRGQVLSVVVEREEEDSSSMHRIIHEPVPGQKEGLVDPLELDGEYTGIVELPTSITPRARSMERARDRGASLGESSRPSTGGLEKIDERQGV